MYLKFAFLATAMSIVAMAQVPTVTVDPSTSAAWPVGTSFEPGEVSATTNPLGPFSGIPIQFRGWNSGGSQVSMNGNPCSNTNPCLVFDYHLTFPTPTAIASISFTGDAFNGATFQLLDSTNTVIATLSVSSGNVGHPVTYTMLTPGAVGTSFTLKLFDTSSTWTFVSRIMLNAGSDTAFQVRYTANLDHGESYIAISNDGANGAPLLGPGFGGAAGNICVNVYAFSPDEQLISCCSCLVTPNGLVNLGVNRDLTSKTLTGVIPTSVVVKLVSTLAGTGGAGTSCTNSAATATTAPLAPGMVAWGTTIHNGPPGVAGYNVTETPFTPALVSPAELASIVGRCAAILGNGSGFGICRSCQAGALGATRSF